MEGVEQESILTLVTFDPSKGRALEVPLRFVVHEGRAYVLASGNPSPRWVQGMQGKVPLRWRIGPEAYFGRAEVLHDRRLIGDTILPAFRSKYGPERVEHWFGAGFLCLRLLAEGGEGSGYHAQVEALFDAIAPGYDATVAGNAFDRYLREVSLQILGRIFREGDHVLEIGCGTGLETLPLAHRGVEIVAVDLSDGMLKRLRKKVLDEGLLDRVVIRKLAAHELGKIVAEFGPRYFDGAFSNFGAINCEPHWGELPAVLGELIRSGGPLMLGVWNRVCLMEILLFGLGLRPRRALSRLRSPVPVGLSRFGIPVFPLAVEEVARGFSPYFHPEALIGLPVVVPPYDLGGRVPAPDLVMPLLASLDRILRGHFPFSRLGDHFLLTMRRREPLARSSLAVSGGLRKRVFNGAEYYVPNSKTVGTGSSWRAR